MSLPGQPGTLQGISGRFPGKNAWVWVQPWRETNLQLEMVKWAGVVGAGVWRCMAGGLLSQDGTWALQGIGSQERSPTDSLRTPFNPAWALTCPCPGER